MVLRKSAAVLTAFSLLSTAKADKCDTALTCSDELVPVCSVDKIGVYQTMANQCCLTGFICKEPNRGLSLAHNGRCTDKEMVESLCISQKCHHIYMPVCGSDGDTYTNLCELELARCTDATLEPVSNGVCGAAAPATAEVSAQSAENDISDTDLKAFCDEHACDRVLKPVCASNGQTFSNICMLEHKAKCEPTTFAGAPEFLHDGRCAAEMAGLDQCYTQNECDRDHGKVCSSSGETFANQCMLVLTACLRGVSLDIAHDGECEAEDFEGGMCSTLALACPHNIANNALLCGVNGQGKSVLFNSDCEMHERGCNENLAYVLHPNEKCVPDMYSPETVEVEATAYSAADDNTAQHTAETEGSTDDNTELIYNIIAAVVVCLLLLSLAYAIRRSVHLRRQRERAFRFIDLDAELEHEMESTSPAAFSHYHHDQDPTVRTNPPASVTRLSSDDEEELLDQELNGR